MTVLGFDTATPATAVALLGPSGALAEARHDPEPGERPGHAPRLLGLVEEVLAAGGGWAVVRRIAVGAGPGSFTGMRIGIATARALAQARGLPLVGVSTLRVLAEPHLAGGRTVLAVIDARRGEAFAAAYAPGGERLAPAALAPDVMARRVRDLGERVLAVGDGAVRFRAVLEGVGAEVSSDGDPGHRLEAAALCRLALHEPAHPPATVLPDYLRVPDAEMTRRSG